MSKTTNLLFTYGTLMKGQCRDSFLKNTQYIGDAVLDDYGLFETGSYPAAIPVKGFKVYGEVYKINDAIKNDLDYIEGEGFLYKYKIVEVKIGKHKYDVGFYEYIKDTSNMSLRSPVGKWSSKRQDIKDYVWYACYGSNLYQKRFDLYLNKIKTKEYAQKDYLFNHPIYFSQNSSRWQNKGVCFLDLNQEGKAYGWMYLIKKEDINRLSNAEGAKWYPKHFIDKDEFGIDIYTVSHPTRFVPDTYASNDYYTIIAKGLNDRFGLSIKQINDYLHTNIDFDLSDDNIKTILDKHKED